MEMNQLPYPASLKVSLVQVSDELLAGRAGLLCTGSRDIHQLFDPAEESVEDRKRLQGVTNRIIARGHVSVAEHVVLSFAVSGASRALTHQLMRHRLASYSQQSQRYVEFESAENQFHEPDSVRDAGPEVVQKYRAAVASAWDVYKELMLQHRIPAEDARFLLPNAAVSQVLLTMNARELMHFFALRCCDRAQKEIRSLAFEMRRLAMEACPTLFANAGPTCQQTGRCPEGLNSCGKMRTLKENNISH